ncbi:MAG TPA: ABC transporter permease [Candidatus Polarisedimenticolia bacterium]|nr:ABC transporter permease [Candidatus Polarisedimenticolia bacterium]
MSAALKLFRRLRAMVRRPRLDRELDEELQLHIELESRKLAGQGVAPSEARRRALVAFGGLERYREAARDASGVRPLEDFVRDLRLGLRALRKRPGYTSIVLSILGVGIGGSAALFGAVHGILLRPMPYPDAHRIMTVWQQDRKTGEQQEFAPANFLDLRERSASFERLTAIEPFGLDWESPEGPVYLPTWLVYEGFFELFGTQPLLGRAFRPDEHAPGRGQVVVLGFRVWKTRFAGSEDVVGRMLKLDGKPYVVAGVMPEGFAMPGDDAVWAPKVQEGWESRSRTSRFYSVFGRLRPGAGIDEARAELGSIGARLLREHPLSNADLGMTLVPLPEHVVGGLRRALLMLLGAVGFLLAVVTANLASMQLARAAGRRREFAVRAALGAGAGRLARQLLTESLLLAAGGAVLGFALAGASLHGARLWAPAHLPRVAELRADGVVLAFAAGLSLLAMLSTGVLPALVANRAHLQGILALGGRGATGGRRIAGMQSALVVVQLGLSLVLLIGAGLLVRSFVLVLGEQRGFLTDGVVSVTVQTWGYYTKGPDRVRFVREVIERLSRQPGIQSAGMASSVPLMETIGAERAPLTIEGAPPADSPPMVQFTVATPGLFGALGIPLRRGRLLDDRDGADSPSVVLVNEAFARHHFPGEEVLGKRLVLGGSLESRLQEPASREIVGVVGDVRRHGLHEAARPGVYLPHAQSPTGANAFIVRGSLDPGHLLRRIKQVIWGIHPAIPIHRETTMADLVGVSVRERRFLLALLSGFAAAALGLAAAGLFGLMSYVTGERTREFGIRMTLGAPPRQVSSLVLKRAIGLAAAGIGLGLAGAAGLTRILAGFLYGVTSMDPATFAAGAATLLAVTVLATWWPARRAARIDLVETLRQE